MASMKQLQGEPLRERHGSSRSCSKTQQPHTHVPT